MKKQNKSHHTASLSKQVDGLLATWNKTGSPGYAIAVLRQGKVIHTGGYGMADIENSIPLSTQSVFDIGSESKKFVALSVLLLERQGMLKLDDEVQRHLPEIRHYPAPITIRQLIHHTSGLRDYLSIAYLSGTDLDEVHSLDAVIALIARQRDLNFIPGTEHLYSNTGYYLLAKIIHRLSGLSLRVFAEQNIFAPLGMKNTHFHDDHTEVVPNLALGYASKGSGFELGMSTFDVVGAGGLNSTIDDLCRWEANFYNNILGGQGADLLDEMVAPGKLANGEPLAYALGLINSSYRGLKVVEHGGACYGYRSQMMRFPDQGLTVICLANFDQANAYRISKQIADIYLAEEFPVARDEQRVIDLPLAELEAREGFYRGVQASNFWELTVQEGKLMVQGHDMGMTFQIAPVQPDRFIALDTCLDISIDFGERSATGAATMSVRVDNHFSEHLASVDAVAIEQSQLQKYCGDYRSEELGVTYTLTFEDGKIAFRFGSLSDTHLQPINRTLFNCPTTGLMEFIFDADDQVSGFELNLCRARKISFVKVGQKISHTESLAKQVDALFSDWDKPDAPGCAIGIVRG